MNWLYRNVLPGTVVAWALSAAVASAQVCMHPGLLPNGTSGLVPGDCFPTSGLLFQGLPLSTLQQTFDLDVTYIERTPKYPSYCRHHLGCPGHGFCDQVWESVGGASCEPTTKTNNCEALVIDTAHPDGKRWPDPAVGQNPAETVTYIAHIINKGGQQGTAFSYSWTENGSVVATGSHSALAAGAELTLQLQRPWLAAVGTIDFALTPNQPDLFSSNNHLTIDTHALALKIFVYKNVYDDFNKQQSAYSLTFSFEDWIQKHIALMNDRLAASTYNPETPNGVRERVRIDSFQVYTVADNLAVTPQNDLDFYCEDGNWPYTSATVVANIINETPHWNFIHEVGHRLLGRPDAARAGPPLWL
ncbi:hypothetical protein KF840_08460 [bacterium]|nr:hypothetical protein [bacterium]